MINYKKIVDKYIKDVTEGKIVSCELLKKAVLRHVNNLSRVDIQFSEEKAVHFLKFSSKCKYTKGQLAKEGKYIEFTPQQVFRYWCIFGWLRLDGTRLIRKIYIEVARKEGKSEEAAVVGNYGLLMDGEYGSEIYSVATKEDQARLVFEASKEMLRKLKQESETINSAVGIGVKNIHVLTKNAKYEPLAANSQKLDGLNPHFFIVDEYHAHVSSDLLEVGETGMGSRKQPMLFIITTAGFNKQGPCFQLRKVAIDILEGKKEDDSFFAMIFTLDEGDNWQDESVWIKSNPNLGITPSIEFMREQLVKAKNEGASKEVQFKTKNLNIWTDSEVVWITDEDWKKAEGKMPDLTKIQAYGGLDLASTKDFNAYVLIFPTDDKIYLVPHFWIPEETAKAKENKDSYLNWDKYGYIKIVKGSVMDHEVISNDIIQLHKKYKVKGLTYDRYLSIESGIIKRLSDEGIECAEFGQGFISMSEPTKELERLVLSGEIVQDGNPCMRWMMGNIVLRIDPAGNIKIDKGKAQDKVDGCVAAVMSLGSYTAYGNKKQGSKYDKEGIFTL